MPKARDVALVGVYTTKQERVSSKTSLELQIEALWGALDDAGMTMKDVDAWYGSFPTSIAYQFGIPIHHQGGGTGNAALTEAAALIREGLIETAVVLWGPNNQSEATRRPAYSHRARAERSAPPAARRAVLRILLGRRPID